MIKTPAIIPVTEAFTSASRSKGKASFLSEEIPDREILMNKIAETGYSCTGIASEQYVKKGWFGRG